MSTVLAGNNAAPRMRKETTPRSGWALLCAPAAFWPLAGHGTGETHAELRHLRPKHSGRGNPSGANLRPTGTEASGQPLPPLVQMDRPETCFTRRFPCPVGWNQHRPQMAVGSLDGSGSLNDTSTHWLLLLPGLTLPSVLALKSLSQALLPGEPGQGRGPPWAPVPEWPTPAPPPVDPHPSTSLSLFTASLMF